MLRTRQKINKRKKKEKEEKEIKCATSKKIRRTRQNKRASDKKKT